MCIDLNLKEVKKKQLKCIKYLKTIISQTFIIVKNKNVNFMTSEWAIPASAWKTMILIFLQFTVYYSNSNNYVYTLIEKTFFDPFRVSDVFHLILCQTFLIKQQLCQHVDYIFENVIDENSKFPKSMFYIQALYQY